MPMNPRLLRPRQTGSDPDALRYIAAVQDADGQPLEAGVRKAINDFVVGCKADGIWSAIKASCILAGARTLAGALTPLVGAAPTNNNFVSGDYNRKTGLLGNGTTKYLDTGRAGNADPQDNAHLSMYASVIAPVNATAYIGSGSGATSGSHTMVSRASGATTLRARSRNGTVSAGTNAADAVGFLGVSRAASGSFTLRGGGQTDGISQASQTPTSSNVFVFGNSTSTNAIAQAVAARLAWYSVGESLNLALLDARVTSLINAIGAAIP